jgi:hypothetical protein
MTIEEFRKANHVLRLWVTSDNTLMALARVKIKSISYSEKGLPVYQAPYEWFLINWDEYINNAFAYCFPPTKGLDYHDH